MHQASGNGFAIAVHGGAGAFSNVTTVEVEQYLTGLKQALEAGREMLVQGRDSLSAVVEAVRALEDNPLFNSGKGAVFNHDGFHELDAAVMNGKDLACGAVAGVRTVKNPVLLAQAVMTSLPHVLLAGSGADEFAKTIGLEMVDQEYYFSEKRYKEWQDALKTDAIPEHVNGVLRKEKMGTVGSVALDRYGNLAAATSTGGLTNKKFGRVGDSPVIGAGTYANNASCAVSCTGRGEDVIRATAGFDIHALMSYKGLSLSEAAKLLVHEKLPKGSGGLIAISRTGEVVLPFNTQGMLRGYANNEGVFEVALY